MILILKIAPAALKELIQSHQMLVQILVFRRERENLAMLSTMKNDGYNQYKLERVGKEKL